MPERFGSNESTYDLLRASTLGAPGSSGGGDSTYLRLDTTNDPLTGPLDIVTADVHALRVINDNFPIYDETWIGLAGGEMLMCANYFDPGAAVWTRNATTPSNSVSYEFDHFLDGSAAFFRLKDTTIKIVMCTNPHAVTPTWTTILEVGQVLSFGTIDGQYSSGISRIHCAGTTLYTTITIDHDDNKQYSAQYTIAGGWVFSAMPLNGVQLDPQYYQGVYTYNSGGDQYELLDDNVFVAGWQQSQGFSDSAGWLWRNLIGGHYYAERGVNGTPAQYYFSDLNAGDVISNTSGFHTTATAEGYVTLASPRGAWGGPQVYVVGPTDKGLWLSDDGVTFANVATWENGIVYDADYSGGGALAWIRKVIPINDIITRQYDRDGTVIADKTGNIWALIPEYIGGTITVSGGGLTYEEVTKQLFNVDSIGGNTTVKRLVIEEANGSSPLIVTSQSRVVNLNADMVDGVHALSIVQLSADNVFTGANTFQDVTTTAGRRQAVAAKGGNYTLEVTDEVVVFTATATATLPAATGTGQTYRIVCRAGTLTIEGNGADTIKGELTQTIYAGDDLIITDTAAGIWE